MLRINHPPYLCQAHFGRQRSILRGMRKADSDLTLMCCRLLGDSLPHNTHTTSWDRDFDAKWQGCVSQTAPVSAADSRVSAAAVPALQHCPV